MKIIAADVGGTKTHLVISDLDTPYNYLNEAIYDSRRYDGFEEILSTFIGDICGEDDANMLEIDTMTLALPCVIDGDEVRLTNLPWVINRQTLMQKFGISTVRFINDFQASAIGTLSLHDSDIVTLNPGSRQPANQNGAVRVVLGAGTGLGMAWLRHDVDKVQTVATEGGHVDFAPTDARQAELLDALRARYGHVSYERLLSGSGLVNIYEFVSGHIDSGIEAAWISQQAQAGDEIAHQALKMFIQIYGAFAGNLAILGVPDDGIYITGGMAAKLAAHMQSEDFIEAYRNKGRMRCVADSVAVYLVMNQGVGVLGAISETVRKTGKQP